MKRNLISGDGYITTTVLKEIMKELDPKLTKSDLDNMIEEIDEDGSGTVDFDGKYSVFAKKKYSQNILFRL